MTSQALKADKPDELGELSVLNLKAPTHGYLYVYVTNQDNRMVSFDNFMILHSSGILMQENHYYPYGMLIEGLSNAGTGLPQNMYRYTDKEAQNDLNQNLLDFGWRQYDPVIARWHVTDPAEQYYNPYLAISANPVSIIDPDGRKGTKPPWEDAGNSDQLSTDLNGFGGGGRGGNSSFGPTAMQQYVGSQMYSMPEFDNTIYAITSNGATTVCSTCGSTEMQNGAVIISNVNTGAAVGVISSSNGTYSSAAPGQTISSTNGHHFVTETFSGITMTENWNETPSMLLSFEITRSLGTSVQGGGPNYISGVDLLFSMYIHYQVGQRKDFHINATRLDFSWTNQTELGLNTIGIGQTKDPVSLYNVQINPISLAFGKLIMTRVSDTEFTIASEIFKFDYQPGDPLQRNVGTFIGGLIVNGFYPYLIALTRSGS